MVRGQYYIGQDLGRGEMRTKRTWLAAFMLGLSASIPNVSPAEEATHDTLSTVVNPLIPRLADIPGTIDPTLVSNLRKGGYIIFFRHTATDWGQKDVAGENFENRATQRNLNEAGKADAAGIGRAFKTLEIPIDSVFASPMMRCRDTARIAFGREQATVDLFRKGPEYRAKRLMILSTAPNPGFNRVLVGQQDPIIPIIPGLHRDELREGEALVIQPLGNGKFKVIVQVTLADWARLAAAYPATTKPLGSH